MERCTDLFFLRVQNDMIGNRAQATYGPHRYVVQSVSGSNEGPSSYQKADYVLFKLKGQGVLP